MTNKFYEPGETRGRKVQELFARIAPRYDLINDLQSFGLHRLWKRRLVRLANPKPGERALDVCCGTGDLSFGLARKGVNVMGIDFSEEMLAIARERLGKRTTSPPQPEPLHEPNRSTPPPTPSSNEEEGECAAVRGFKARKVISGKSLPEGGEGMEAGSRVEFVLGDASNLCYSNDSFDIVTVGYGLRNLSDWRAGLAEMHRVSKPGGRLLVLDFGKPDNAVWRTVYFGYLRLVVPLFGKIFCGDAQTYSYILESLTHFLAQKGIAAALQELGCTSVRTYNLLGGIMSINYAQKR